MDLKKKCDIYEQLLKLGSENEVEPFLKQALVIIVETTGARRAYIELSGGGSAEGRGATSDDLRRTAPPFSMAHGCSDTEVEAIRTSFSSGIIAAALATGETIVTSSASEDPRFRDRGSVKRNRIEAVLCAPIGTATPLGVLYLQDRDEPGPFSEEDRADVEWLTRSLEPFADRLLIRRRHLAETDPTRPYRAKLRAEEVVGRSQALATLLKQAALAAPHKLSVLLTGATGTGKTQIAHAIHASGPRATKRFIELNCATLQDTLAENELFGAVRGGHSGGPVEGKVTWARGGTLFLDEIGILPMAVQAKLLQFLQSKEYFPIGSPQPLKADVRIIAATNVNLKALVAEQKFREDLLSRIEVMTIRVPSLAERREDIADLAEHFCQSICEENELPRLKLSVSALCALEAAEWPSNIRQLSNVITNAAINAAGEGVLQIEQRHLFPDPEGQANDGRMELVTYQAATRQFQKQLVKRMLEETDWNIAEAARRFEMSRSNLNNLIKAFKLVRKKSDPPRGDKP